MAHSMTLDMPLGEIHFSVGTPQGAIGLREADLRVVEFRPNLLSGMYVRRARAVVLSARLQAGFDALDFGYRFVSEVIPGPDSGQTVDALAWEGRHDIVLVGTETGEALYYRMPWIEAREETVGLVEYSSDGLNIPLRRVPAGARIGLHYVVAENDNPEPAECSAWFAVDTPHGEIVRGGG